MVKKKREIQKRKKHQDPGPPDDSQIVVRVPAPPGKAGGTGRSSVAGEGTVFSRGRENLLLGLLVLYVFLLGLGTFGELFEVEWILNLPLFR